MTRSRQQSVRDSIPVREWDDFMLLRKPQRRLRQIQKASFVFGQCACGLGAPEPARRFADRRFALEPDLGDAVEAV